MGIQATPLSVIESEDRHILVYIPMVRYTPVKKIMHWQLGGFMATATVGTLLHFLFDWTGGNVIVALFSAVNESIWEHLKLLFYPSVAVAVVQYFFWGKTVQSFWCIKLMGVLFGLVLIPVVYYTYTGILGVNADWFNITIFFLVAAALYWVETKLFQRGYTCQLGPGLAVTLIFLIAIAFTVFTFVPPHIPFFQDPMTGTYGFLQ